MKLTIPVLCIVIAALCASQLQAQPNLCSALSKGAGALYGGNITSLDIQDDTGLIYSYSGFTNNVTVAVVNSGSAFDVNGNEYLAFDLKGTSDSSNQKWWTRCGIWIDANRDGDFTADECVADPVSGPFKRLIKDTAVSSLVHVPNIFTSGPTRIRIRGCRNTAVMTAADGCGDINDYGNQFDFLINAYYGVSGIRQYTLQQVKVTPNPAKGMAQVQIKPETGILQRIELLDLQGKSVKEWKQPEIVNGSASLNIEGISAGTYVVHTIGSLQHNSSKLVIQE